MKFAFNWELVLGIWELGLLRFGQQTLTGQERCPVALARELLGLGRVVLEKCQRGDFLRIMKRSKIVVVDDNRNFLRVVSYQLRDLGFEVFETVSAEEAISQVQEESPSLVITDLRMPEMDGLELLDRLLVLDPGLPVIVLTAHGTIEQAVEATRKGAFDFLTKPFEVAELKQTIAGALRLSSLVLEDSRFSEAIDGKCKPQGIPGHSRGGPCPHAAKW